MGAFKDVVDLTTQLCNSAQDRKVTAEIRQIQSLILTLQKEYAALVSENFDLKNKIFKLEKENLALNENSSDKNLRDKYIFHSTYGVYESKESGHYFCTSCLMKKIESPLTKKENGWRCELKGCDKFYENPSYKYPKQCETDYDPYKNL
jgi:predicted RNase H-like nuclease (RuvC/YqgF family)